MNSMLIPRPSPDLHSHVEKPSIARRSALGLQRGSRDSAICRPSPRVARIRQFGAQSLDLAALVGFLFFVTEALTVSIDFFTAVTVPSGHLILACGGLLLSLPAFLSRGQ
jgi:hypothetical protein